MMYLTIMNLVLVVLGFVTFIILYLRTVKKGKRQSKHVQEFLKALDEAERYNDKEGWISVKKIDRAGYMQIR